MKRTFVVLAIFFCLFILKAQAETSVKAQVDKKSITTDEAITYKFIITTDEKNIPLPQMPKFEGFNVISKAQSSTMSFAKNKIKNFLVYIFILTPAKTGKLRIMPASITINKQIFFTAALEIEVRLGKAKPLLPNEEKISPGENPANPLPQSAEPKITL